MKVNPDLAEELYKTSYALSSEGDWLHRNYGTVPNNACSRGADEILRLHELLALTRSAYDTIRRELAAKEEALLVAIQWMPLPSSAMEHTAKADVQKVYDALGWPIDWTFGGLVPDTEKSTQDGEI